jgi:hypothetical protein
MTHSDTQDFWNNMVCKPGCRLALNNTITIGIQVKMIDFAFIVDFTVIPSFVDGFFMDPEREKTTCGWFNALECANPTIHQWALEDTSPIIRP